MDLLNLETENLKTLRTVLNHFLEIDEEDLCRRELPEGDFEDLLPVLRILKQNSQDILLLDLSNAPAPALAEASQSANTLYSILNSIIEAPPEAFTRDHQERLKLNAVSRWRELQPSISMLFNYGLRNSVLLGIQKDLDDSLKRASELNASLDLKTKNLENALENVTEKFNNIANHHAKKVEEIQAVMDKLGVANYAHRFQDEAVAWEKSAKKWLIAAIVSGAGLVAMAIVFSAPPAQAKELGILINWGANRLLALSVFSVAIFVSLRNHSAARHNWIVNRHRQNALMTFDIFNKGTADVETKKAILLQSMQAIFAPQPTGYLKAAAESQSGPQIVEFIKNVVGKES